MIIVSNRLPTRVEVKEGKISLSTTVGGLATGLRMIHKKGETVWIGWPGVETEKEKLRSTIEKKLWDEHSYLPVFLPEGDFRRYYSGFSNGVIWPLFHYFLQYCVYERSAWDAYVRVNRLFCERVVETTGPRQTIWIHDYHLLLLPQMLREKLPDARIGFFLHIPFPSMEIFRYLPWSKQILRGMLGANLIGFHTFGYARHFLSSVARLLGLQHEFGEIGLGNRVVQVDAFPMGIDIQRLANTAGSSSVKKRVAYLRKKTDHRKVVLSVDRLDYTKGIVERLKAIEFFLGKYSNWHEKVKFILVCTPSRTRVTQYQLLKKSVDELVGKINGRYGRIGWTPIWYLYQTQGFDRLVPLYCAADVGLVTPLRDGMNLIAKEYVASHVDEKGVLILSETAGASLELGEATIVNLNDTEQVASAINEALLLPEKEQSRRIRIMQKRLRRYDVFRWAKDFTDRLKETTELREVRSHKKLNPDIMIELVDRYRSSKRRLLLLDYDGTLAPIERTPDKAKPSNRVIRLLKQLAAVPKNTVVVISGRDRDNLENWLGMLPIDLIAEHGTWVRRRTSKKWRTLERQTSHEWKEKVRDVLEVFVDRTPGALIEEKCSGLAWHYRMTDPDMGALRARELVEELKELLANMPLQVITGSKVIEVRCGNIDKGKAALEWISDGYDFVLAIGDDETDEDLFDVIPQDSWSIKVGAGDTTKARFSVDSTDDAVCLLEVLTR